MNRMPCSVSDSDNPDDEQIIPEPEFEEHPDPKEPEDNFLLSVRLRMMINHIANHGSFDQRRLIQLLKDAKQMADSHTELCSKVDDTADKLRESLLGRPQA